MNIKHINMKINTADFQKAKSLKRHVEGEFDKDMSWEKFFMFLVNSQ